MIHAIWYPSGGFGHYVNSVIRKYVFAENIGFEYSNTGNSHSLDGTLPKYLHSPSTYPMTRRADGRHTVLVDNGIDDENTQFKNTFPDATVIKICYTDWSWPVVAATSVEKAQVLPLDSVCNIDRWSEPADTDWVRRESYYLYLRQSQFRGAWRPDVDCETLLVDDILDYQAFRTWLYNHDLEASDFTDHHAAMVDANIKYIDPYLSSQRVLSAIAEERHEPMPVESTLWHQAVLHYMVTLKYNIELPAYDYRHWFQNTTELRNAILQQQQYDTDQESHR